MNERGNYKKDPFEGWIRPDTPGESLSRQTFGTAPTNPTGAMFLMLGGLAAIGVAGIVGLGVSAFTKSKTPHVPATTSQKIVRVGLLGGLVGTGAYLYFAGQPQP